MIEVEIARIATALEKILLLLENAPVLGVPVPPAAVPAPTPETTTAVPPGEPEKPKRTRRTAAQIAADEAAAKTAEAIRDNEPVVEDPFEATVVQHTRDQVREALTGYSRGDKGRQAVAVSIMKRAGDADTLTLLKPEKFAAVIAAVKATLAAEEAAAVPTAPVEEADPFDVSPPAPVVAEPTLSLEDVKQAILAAQKITGSAVVQKIVGDNGGIATTPEGPKVSLKALPVSKYATVIAQIRALPKTK